MLPEVTTEVFDAASPLFEDAIRLYARIFGLDFQAEQPFARTCACHPDFCGVLARMDTEPVGVAWGMRSSPGEWFYDRYTAAVGEMPAQFENAWLLAVLGVVEQARQRGIARHMVDVLLERQPCCAALVCTPADNRTARHFYERTGWLYVHDGCPLADGRPPFVVLGKHLSASVASINCLAE